MQQQGIALTGAKPHPKPNKTKGCEMNNEEGKRFCYKLYLFFWLLSNVSVVLVEIMELFTPAGFNY